MGFGNNGTYNKRTNGTYTKRTNRNQNKGNNRNQKMNYTQPQSKRLNIENLNIHKIKYQNINNLEGKYKSYTTQENIILTKRGMIKIEKDNFILYKLKKNKNKNKNAIQNYESENNTLTYKKYIICDFPYEWKKIGQIDTFSNVHQEITIKKKFIKSQNSSLKLVLEYFSDKILDCYFIVYDEMNQIIEKDIRLFIDILI
jgi:hypothetical protein